MASLFVCLTIPVLIVILAYSYYRNSQAMIATLNEQVAMTRRAASRSTISVVKRRHGLNRCQYRGDDGMHRWVGLGVIADNLISIANATANSPAR